MKQVQIVFGQGFDKNGKPLVGAEAKLQEMERIAANRFGGYSLNYGYGGWVDPQGNLVNEPNATLTIVTAASETAILSYAQEIKDTFNQQSVLVTISLVSIDFV